MGFRCQVCYFCVTLSQGTSPLCTPIRSSINGDGGISLQSSVKIKLNIVMRTLCKPESFSQAKDTFISKCRLTAPCSGRGRKVIWSLSAQVGDWVNCCRLLIIITSESDDMIIYKVIDLVQRLFGVMCFPVSLETPSVRGVVMWSHLCYHGSHR